MSHKTWTILDVDYTDIEELKLILSFKVSNLVLSAYEYFGST
jgi:hypothetical protein